MPNEVPVTMGFYAVAGAKPGGSPEGGVPLFLNQFADVRIRVATLEWLGQIQGRR